MISDIKPNRYYKNLDGDPVQVIAIFKHGLSLMPIVGYIENPETRDTLVLEAGSFKSIFSEYTEGKFHERNLAIEASERAALETREAFRVAFSDTE